MSASDFSLVEDRRVSSQRVFNFSFVVMKAAPHSRGLRLGVKHALRASALAGIVVVDNYAFECLESCRAVS